MSLKQVLLWTKIRFFLGGAKHQEIGTLTFIRSDPKALRRVPQPRRSEQVERLSVTGLQVLLNKCGKMWQNLRDTSLPPVWQTSTRKV